MSGNADELLKKLRALNEDLTSINEDLDSAEPIDSSTIDALSHLIDDITERVERANVPKQASADTGEHGDLNDRIVQFETDHPRVTRFLSQLTDMLAMMGI